MLDSLFHFLCHRIPARSPAFERLVFPVCFRCAGLYAGILCSYLFLALNGGLRRRFPERNCALTAAVPAAFFLVDAWANGLGIWRSPGWLRALTGLGAGIAIPVLLLPLAGRGTPRLPSLANPAALLWPALAGAGFVWLLDHPGNALVFRSMAVTAAAGLICFVVNISFAWWGYAHERSGDRHAG